MSLTHRRRLVRSALSVLALAGLPAALPLAAPLSAQVPAPSLVGAVCHGANADCNVCVGDVPSSSTYCAITAR